MSDIAPGDTRAMLLARLDASEHEIAFGRVKVTMLPLCAGLLSEQRLLWGDALFPTRVGSLQLDTVTSFRELEESHRWGIRLSHGEITQRVHVPAHRFLWWSWGNAEAPKTFTESEFWFSRRDTALASAFREALARRQT